MTSNRIEVGEDDEDERSKWLPPCRRHVQFAIHIDAEIGPRRPNETVLLADNKEVKKNCKSLTFKIKVNDVDDFYENWPADGPCQPAYDWKNWRV